MADGSFGVPSVLVVEDDVDVAASLAAFLENNGFDVHLAHSGEVGLEKLLDLAVDVIISDFRMHPMNGIEFLRQARHLTDAPAILFTAYPDLEVALDAANLAHVAHFLRKPGDPQQLLDVANRLALGRHEARMRSLALRRATQVRDRPLPRAEPDPTRATR